LPAGSPDVDATFCCLAMFWPVVNPIGRYRLAKQLAAGADPPDWAVRHIPLHDHYWRSEANMTDGSPLFALERGEAARLPPALLIQPRIDQQHIYEDPGASTPGTDLDKFVAAYRRTGASLDLAYYDAPQYFTTQNPNSAASQDAFARVVAFFRHNIPDPQAG
jgi:acetyl esterase